MFECTMLEWITIVCTGLLGITGICLVVYGLWTVVADAIDSKLQESMRKALKQRDEEIERLNKELETSKVCWHCGDVLYEEGPPNCEDCPSYEIGCYVEGCVDLDP